MVTLIAMGSISVQVTLIVIYDYSKSCSCFIITTFVLGYFTSLTSHVLLIKQFSDLMT